MNYFKKTGWVFCTFLAVASCKKADNLNIAPPVDLGGETWKPTAIDQWLRDSLTIPYNISVKYHWEPFELTGDLDKTLTPPDESKIIIAMSALKRVWIEPYNVVTGSDMFIKQYSPKQFHLVGSVKYNFNGTAVAGQAEGGNNIAFLDINQNYFKNPIASVKDMIHTSHHEFAHNLAFITIYPQEFIGISNKLGMKGYTATWFNISEDEALANGYITSYAMAKHEEDFAEMVSKMLVLGKTVYNELVNSVNPVAQQAFRSKEQIVVNYYRDVWNIDFYALQTAVQKALYTFAPVTEVQNSYGFDKEFTTAKVAPDTRGLLPQSAAFTARYNESADSVAALPNFGLTLTGLEVISSSASETILRMVIDQGGSKFAADFLLSVSISNNVYSYTFVKENQNAQIIHDAVLPLLNYFTNNQFTLSWYAKPDVTYYPRIKFTPVATPSAYFLGLLLN